MKSSQLEPDPPQRSENSSWEREWYAVLQIGAHYWPARGGLFGGGLKERGLLEDGHPVDVRPLDGSPLEGRLDGDLYTRPVDYKFDIVGPGSGAFSNCLGPFGANPRGAYVLTRAHRRTSVRP